MDRGIWATWYDLPGEGKEEYISWLHEVHLPEALKRPGYLWAAHVANIWDEEREKNKGKNLTHTDDASVPAGNDYLLLFGAALPTTFLDPSPAQLTEKRTSEEREMFGRRIGERSCIFMERDRIDGFEANTRAPGITPGPAIQIGTFNINALENEDELGSWYAQVRMPRLEEMEGCVGARNLISVSGWPKHGIMYEWVSLESLTKNFTTESVERSRNAVKSLIHAPGSPTLGERIWPPV
ncbi:MAG TPA: hypothetical protein DDZ83_15770 [Nitrospinae bacterium]|nr:hypothetical protein [Nitrospinota bacterium]